MAGSTVISVRVPKEVVEGLRKRNIKIQSIVRAALIEEYRRRVLTDVENKTRDIVRNLTDAQIVEAIREGRT